MKRVTAMLATATALALSATLAPAASATTITLPTTTVHAKAYVIRPVAKLPIGAKLVTAVVTVRKGTKVVAKNVSKVTVPRGTFLATSVITYRPKRTATVNASIAYAQCRVATAAVTSDRTTLNPDDGSGNAYLSGQATITYTGSCVGYDTNYVSRTFDATWVEDSTVLVDPASNGILSDSSVHKIGDVTTVGGLFTPVQVVSYGTAVTQVTVRKVVVKA